MLAALRADATAGIPHLHNGEIILPLQRQGNGASRRGELDRVGDQIVPYKGEHFRVGGDAQILGKVGFDAQLLALPLVLKAQQTRAKLFAEVEGIVGRMDLLILQLAEPENIGDQIGKLYGGLGDFSGILHALFLGQCRHGQKGAVIPDGRERGLEFVRNIGDEVGAQCFGTGQLLRHAVEVVDDRIQSIRGAHRPALVDADGKVTVHDLLRRLDDPLHRAIHRKPPADIVDDAENKADEDDIKKGSLRRDGDILLGEFQTADTLHGVQEQ